MNKSRQDKKYSLLNFLTDPSNLFDPKKYSYIKKESEEYLIIPLKVITLLIAISGLFSMVFEVRYYSEYSLQVYVTRLLATLIAFVILVILNTKHALKNPVILVHTLLLSIIVSTGYMIFLMPDTLIVNSQIVGLMIFTSALFLSWEVKNQIIVAIYYNIVFASAILINENQIYFLPNLFESVIFVLFLSVISVVGSAVNFKLRSELAEKSFRINVSEKKYRNIIENSPQGIFQTTFDGKFITVNRALIHLLGYNSSDEIKALNIEKNIYYYPEEREKLISLLEKKGSITNYNLSLKKKDGTKIVVLLNDRIVKDEETNKYFFEGNIQDITGRIDLEEERAITQEQLKLEKLKSDQLALEAVKSNEIKSQFLANMSHEIRTPMNGILGFLNLIQQGSYNSKEELNDYVSSAKASGESLLGLLNDILDFSKIEAGKFELEETNFNLNHVIKEAVSTVITRANEKGLRINVDIDFSTPLNLLGDASRLRQIIINLLSNAVKFTETGEIKIGITSERMEEHKIKLNAFVKDSGIGIPAEKKRLLFEPFSQLDGTHSRKFGGTGLGLAITKQLVQMMNGEINVESEENNGSTFSFNIILGVQKKLSFITALKTKQTKSISAEHKEISVPDSKMEVNISEEELKRARGEYQIILAEDNPVNQKVALKIISDAGFNIEAVENGLEALKAVQLKEYDLILMDIQMPEMDGFTATQKIRELPGNVSRTPIIAMTAHALLGDREKCIEAGMNDYVSKPIKPKGLINLLDTWLKVNMKEELPVREIEEVVQIFDKEHFSSVSMDNEEFQKELLQTYISDINLRIAKLDDYIRNDKMNLIVNESHAIKGASYSIGAKLMGDEAKEIETNAKAGDNTKAVVKINALKKAFELTKIELAPYLN